MPADSTTEHEAALNRQTGVVTPGTAQELDGRAPEHLAPWWDCEDNGWHTPRWWRRLWESSGKADVDRADLLPDGAANALAWEEVVLAADPERGSPRVAAMLRADAVRTLGFARTLESRKRQQQGSGCDGGCRLVGCGYAPDPDAPRRLRPAHGR
ncbi:hypothetical protein [Streptomyces sp. NPDC127038]|uniref:hypothetical protein n=1 Tax=Streptomyces sp. NPDC127038 TaxID=3347114 RepID=UPI00364B1F2C